MEKFLNKIKKKLIWFLVSFVLSEWCLVVVTQLIMTFSEFKLSLTTTILLETVKETLLHPFQTIQILIETKNPLFIMGTIGLLLYCASIQIKLASKEKKEGWEADERNQYHGSARWAREKEIFDGKNYLAQSKQEILKNFTASLDQPTEGEETR
ncbi:hypothetical protein LHA31_12205 (plasmid) [Carnobacterium viridans]|uniref:Uncharacterized protein n=1 Tax=Carnobacterium viridans TaxID=174587 RepID=A0A1H0XHY8_9LACT|nr:hypothetical protein [Carnobacterium viridans]UDE96412.1 hypothetical protein LHA31_12205 [Carnobacterium viridans]SDQ02560.1 hypothetical protein SAMN04487752_0071 [Carnobacterium viridans]SDQ02667.1 hypothetical protein SAMN04487752_0190 [Carnobacterium viridans]